MDVSAGSVSYTIKADTSDFDKGIAKINGEFSTISSSANSAAAGINKSLHSMTQAANENSHSAGLNRMQWQEMSAALRHSTDAIIAGVSPMRALAMEGVKMSSVFSSGKGGVVGTLSAMASMINPVVAGIAILAAGVGALVYTGISWVHSYENLEAASKTTTIAIKDLVEMQKEASKTKGGFDVTTGMASFSKNIREAQLGGGQLAKILQENGIALNDSNQKAREMKDVFADVAKLISQTGNELDKQAFAEKLGLGSGAVEFAEKYADALRSGNLELTRTEQHSLNLKKQAEALDKAWIKVWGNVKTYTENYFLSAINDLTNFSATFYGDIYAIGETFGDVVAKIVTGTASITSVWEIMWKSIYNYTIDGLQKIDNAFIITYNRITGYFGANSKNLVDFSSLKASVSTQSADAGKAVVKTFSDYATEAKQSFLKRFTLTPDELVPDMTKSDSESFAPKNDSQIKGLYGDKTDGVQKYIEQLKLANDQSSLEVSLFGASNIQRTISINLAKLNATAQKEGRIATSDEKTQVEDISTEYAKQHDILEKLNDLHDLSNSLASTFTSALDGWITKGEKFSGVLKGILQSLASSVLQGGLSGTGPFAKLFGTAGTGGGFGSLFGSLFGSGATAGASAGVGASIAGAGAGGFMLQASIPSFMGSGSQRSSSTQQSNPPIVNFHITTQNAESFRRSEGQVSAMLARSVSKGYKGL